VKSALTISKEIKTTVLSAPKLQPKEDPSLKEQTEIKTQKNDISIKYSSIE
jgi:hypothetical protein